MAARDLAGLLGAKPAAIIKSGFAVWGPLGSGSGSTRLGEPLVYGGLFGAIGATPSALPAVYSSSAGTERVAARWPGPSVAVHGVRRVLKHDLNRNGTVPEVRVDEAREQVKIGGGPVELEPVVELPLNRAYYLT